MASLVTWIRYWVGAIGITFAGFAALVLLELLGVLTQPLLAISIVAILLIGHLYARRMGVSLWSQR